MKFPTPNEGGEVRADQMMARQCYLASLQTAPCEALIVERLDTRDEAKVLSSETADGVSQILLNLKLPD